MTAPSFSFVTVETAPDSGTRLRREVQTNTDDCAPDLAKAMLQEVVDTYPAGSATVKAMIAVTFSGAGRGLGRARDAEEVARDLAARSPWLSQSLHATGAGAADGFGEPNHAIEANANFQRLGHGGTFRRT